MNTKHQDAERPQSWANRPFAVPVRALRFPASQALVTSAQSFEDYEGKTLSKSSVRFAGMAKGDKTLPQILAFNLRFFMAREKCPYKNANSLGKAAGVAPNTVRNLLDPKKRTVTTEKPDGFPQLDNVAKVAAKIGAEVWEMFHPDIGKSIRERELYASVTQQLETIVAKGNNKQGVKV